MPSLAYAAIMLVALIFYVRCEHLASRAIQKVSTRKKYKIGTVVSLVAFIVTLVFACIQYPSIITNF